MRHITPTKKELEQYEEYKKWWKELNKEEIKDENKVKKKRVE